MYEVRIWPFLYLEDIKPETTALMAMILHLY